METVDDRTLKQKIKDGLGKAKIWAEDKWKDTKTFVRENKGEILFVTMILGPGLLKMGDTAIKRKMQEKERKYDDCDYYDPRTGEHWYTRKPLTTNQRLNLERRYNNGESKGEILRSMHML